MPLPIVILPTREKWDCHQCGICCRGSIVPLSEEDLARLRSQKWEEHPDYLYLPTVVPIKHSTKTHRLAQRADGCCVFLNDKGLCRIHSELGYEAKPTICRVFPLQLIPQDKQVALTIRRACPSSALDLGQEMEGHLPFIRQLVKEGRLSTEPIVAPLLKNRRTTRLEDDVVLESAAGILQDERYPPVCRLVHVLQFAHLLQKARTRTLDDRKLVELSCTLQEHVAEESKPFFVERRRPSGYGRVSSSGRSRLSTLDFIPSFVLARTGRNGWEWRTLPGESFAERGHAKHATPFPGSSFRRLGKTDWKCGSIY